MWSPISVNPGANLGEDHVAPPAGLEPATRGLGIGQEGSTWLAEFAFKQLRWGVKSRAWARFHPVRLGIFPRYSQAGGPVVSGRPPMPTGVLVPHVVADLVRSDTPSGYQTTGATSATAGITAWAGGRLSRRSRSILTALTSCFVYPVPGCATESSGVYGQDYGQRCVHCAGFRPRMSR